MTKTSYHHGNLKDTILDEVLKLLNFKSFDEISFRSISRNIGVVSSAPYNHFKDKKHLIKEVILLGEKKLFNIILIEKKKHRHRHLSIGKRNQKTCKTYGCTHI